MQIGDINYEKRYALAEVDEIIKHMDEECRNKIPKEIVDTIRKEKKFGYKPDFDFSKPLSEQITKQETKDFIAYLYINYICDNESDKQNVLMQISKNAAKEKEKKKKEHIEEIRRKANEQPQSLDSALKNRLNK